MEPNEMPIEIISESAPQAPPIYQRNDDGEYVRRPSLLERLLSPQSLQWMMTVGGGMLVIGYVVWLWSIGIFDNPVVVAVTMGGAIAAVISVGVGMVKFSRYQLAGNGLTLLGAMAMPLQLWFYHAQHLINLNDGGHLWMPAAAFCLVYAVIARVLRNPAFVYTFVGGIVTTGMLFLADQSVNQFWNLLPQVTFLVGLGWVFVFAEKWFVETDSDFDRSRFGQSFFRAGIVTVLGGLSLLLASQVAGNFYDTIVYRGYVFAQYAPVPVQQWWVVGVLSVTALGIVLAIPKKGRGLITPHRRQMSLWAVLVWIAVCLFAIFNITLNVATMSLVSVAAVAGLLMIVIGRSTKAVPEEDQPENSLKGSIADDGRILVLSGNVVAMLFAVNMVFSGGTSLALALVIGVQMASAMAAIFLSKSEGWRNGFIASSILLAMTGALVGNAVIPFSVPTKVEFVAVMVGAVLLLIGHVAWAKEDESTRGSTTAALWFGSLLLSLPLLIALFCYRYLNVAGDTGFAQFGHEVAVLATALLLVAAGILCRIRSTTIVGAMGMVIYVTSLLTMIPLPEKLQNISVIMMVGGGVFFTTAILLSVYRERIIAIPQRFDQRAGIFQVLKWR